MKIAVIGSNMVDLITYIDSMPKLGETREARSFEMGCGGKGANQAVAAAKLGSSVMMVSKVGDDMFAYNTLVNLQQHGIDTRYVTKVENMSSGVAPIFVDPSSQNRILIIKGANATLSPTDIDQAADSLKQCQLILLQLEVPLATVYHAISFANQHHIPVILNPAPADASLDIDMVCQCDFFIPNETELEILTRLPVSNEEDLRIAANSLMEKGLKNLIVTLGDKGAIWLHHKEFYPIQPCVVQAVDTSGAGDAFIGAFAHYFVATKNIFNALKEATFFAAYSVTKKGTQLSYPDKECFEQFKARYYQR